MSAAQAGLILRAAAVDDAELLFRWANDPAVRAAARDGAPIAWDGHVRWLTARLASADCRVTIAERDGCALGQVRLDRHGDWAEVDISVDPAARGQGVGLALLAHAAGDNFSGLARLVSAVRVENTASLALFRAAGYRQSGDDGAFVHFERELP